MEDARSNSNIWINRNRPLKVLVCAVTLVAFLFSTMSYDLALAAGTPSGLPGVGSEKTGSPGLFKDLNVETFVLPEYMGYLRDSFKAGRSDRVVIHIQDAHCNYYAQKKISEIIDYINGEYGVNMINLEGGAKDYDLSPFTSIADKNTRERASDYFVKQGLVNGAEYFAVNNPGKVKLWGIEDVKLYIDNLNTYRNSIKHKDEIDRSIKSLSYILTNLKTRIYSKELLEFDMKYLQYKAANIEFKDYLNYLIGMAKANIIDVKHYKNIYLLNQSLIAESGVDFKKANDQRDSLIDKLQKTLSRKALEGFLAETVEFKMERISQKDFYGFLLKKADSVKIDMAGFPELQKYIAYISIYGAIDKAKVMEEADALEDAVRACLYQNDTQKELATLSKNLALIKNLFGISMTKEDYKYYKANGDSFAAKNYLKFIEKEAPLYKIMAQPDSGVENLDSYREEMSAFYEYSLKRDNAFVSNIKFPPVRAGPSASIIITGGFHTENLAELFKKQGISYISIMPNFKSSEGYECPYYKILSGEDRMRIKDALPSVLKNTLATPDQNNPIIWGAIINKKSPSAVAISSNKAIELAGYKGELIQVLDNGTIKVDREAIRNILTRAGVVLTEELLDRISAIIILHELEEAKAIRSGKKKMDAHTDAMMTEAEALSAAGEDVRQAMHIIWQKVNRGADVNIAAGENAWGNNEEGYEGAGKRAFERGNAKASQILDQRLDAFRERFGESIAIYQSQIKASRLMRYRVNGRRAYFVELFTVTKPFNVIAITDKNGTISELYLGRPIRVSEVVALYRYANGKGNLPDVKGEDFIELKEIGGNNSKLAAEIGVNIRNALVDQKRLEEIVGRTTKPLDEYKWEFLTAPNGSIIARALIELRKRGENARKAVNLLLGLPYVNTFDLVSGKIILKAEGVEGGHYMSRDKEIVLLVDGDRVSGSTFIHEYAHHICNDMPTTARERVLKHFNKKYTAMLRVLLSFRMGYKHHASYIALSESLGGDVERSMAGLAEEVFAYTLAGLVAGERPFDISEDDVSFLIEEGLLPKGFKSNIIVATIDEPSRSVFIDDVKKAAMLTMAELKEQATSYGHGIEDMEEKEAQAWFNDFVKVPGMPAGERKVPFGELIVKPYEVAAKAPPYLTADRDHIDIAVINRINELIRQYLEQARPVLLKNTYINIVWILRAVAIFFAAIITPYLRSEAKKSSAAAPATIATPMALHAKDIELKQQVEQRLRERGLLKEGEEITPEQLNGIKQAHLIGDGRLGIQNPNGTFNKNEENPYTFAELRAKREELAKAGFNAAQSRIIMEFGFAGAREDDMAKLSGQFDSTVKDLNKLCGSDNDLKKALDIAVNIIREYAKSGRFSDWIRAQGYDQSDRVLWHDYTHIMSDMLVLIRTLQNAQAKGLSIPDKAVVLAAIGALYHDVGYHMNSKYGTVKLEHEERSIEFVRKNAKELCITDPRDIERVVDIIRATKMKDGPKLADNPGIVNELNSADPDKRVNGGIKLAMNIIAVADVYDMRPNGIARTDDLYQEFGDDAEILESNQDPGAKTESGSLKAVLPKAGETSLKKTDGFYKFVANKRASDLGVLQYFTQADIDAINFIRQEAAKESARITGEPVDFTPFVVAPAVSTVPNLGTQVGETIEIAVPRHYQRGTARMSQLISLLGKISDQIKSSMEKDLGTECPMHFVALADLSANSIDAVMERLDDEYDTLDEPEQYEFRGKGSVTIKTFRNEATGEVSIVVSNDGSGMQSSIMDGWVKEEYVSTKASKNVAPNIIYFGAKGAGIFNILSDAKSNHYKIAFVTQQKGEDAGRMFEQGLDGKRRVVTNVPRESVGTDVIITIPLVPAASAVKPLARGGIIYGYFDPKTDTITIDIEKAREAFEKIAPNLDWSNKYKVTGFVHIHEIFHGIVKFSGIKLSESEEEKLADIFANNALGLSPPAGDLELFTAFAAKIKNEDLWKQLSLSYDSPEFLLNLHRLGIDAYNIESAPIGALPQGVKGPPAVVPQTTTAPPPSSLFWGATIITSAILILIIFCNLLPQMQTFYQKGQFLELMLTASVFPIGIFPLLMTMAYVLSNILILFDVEGMTHQINGSRQYSHEIPGGNFTGKWKTQTVMVPVYDEPWSVIRPMLESSLEAIRRYNREAGAGMANMLVCDDGLMALTDNDPDAFLRLIQDKVSRGERLNEGEQEIYERINYYKENGIGVVARPKDNTKFVWGTFTRKGYFKKGSNLNHAHRLLDEMEPYLESGDAYGVALQKARASRRYGEPIFSNTYVMGEPKTGEILLVLDKDSIVPPNGLLHTVKEFIQDPDLAFTQNAIFITNYDKNWFTRLVSHSYEIGMKYYFPLEAHYGFPRMFGHNAFIRKEALKDIDYWNEDQVGEDTAFSVIVSSRINPRTENAYYGKFVQYPSGSLGEFMLKSIDELEEDARARGISDTDIKATGDRLADHREEAYFQLYGVRLPEWERLVRTENGVSRKTVLAFMLYAESLNHFGEAAPESINSLLPRNTKFAHGDTEVLFNPISKWSTDGVIRPFMRKFLADPGIAWHKKLHLVSMMSIAPYYLISFALMGASLMLYSIYGPQLFTTLKVVESFRLFIWLGVSLGIFVSLVHAVRMPDYGEGRPFVERWAKNCMIMFLRVFVMQGVVLYGAIGAFKYLVGQAGNFPPTPVFKDSMKSTREVLSRIAKGKSPIFTFSAVLAALNFMGYFNKLEFNSLTLILAIPGVIAGCWGIACPYLLEPVLWQRVIIEIRSWLARAGSPVSAPAQPREPIYVPSLSSLILSEAWSTDMAKSKQAGRVHFVLDYHRTRSNFVDDLHRNIDQSDIVLVEESISGNEIYNEISQGKLDPDEAMEKVNGNFNEGLRALFKAIYKSNKTIIGSTVNSDVDSLFKEADSKNIEIGNALIEGDHIKALQLYSEIVKSLAKAAAIQEKYLLEQINNIRALNPGKNIMVVRGRSHTGAYIMLKKDLQADITREFLDKDASRITYSLDDEAKRIYVFQEMGLMPKKTISQSELIQALVSVMLINSLSEEQKSKVNFEVLNSVAKKVDSLSKLGGLFVQMKNNPPQGEDASTIFARNLHTWLIDENLVTPEELAMAFGSTESVIIGEVLPSDSVETISLGRAGNSGISRVITPEERMRRIEKLSDFVKVMHSGFGAFSEEDARLVLEAGRLLKIEMAELEKTGRMLWARLIDYDGLREGDIVLDMESGELSVYKGYSSAGISLRPENYGAPVGKSLKFCVIGKTSYWGRCTDIMDLNNFRVLGMFATPSAVKPLARGGIIYGYFDPKTETITIDIEKAREAFEKIAPNLDWSNKYKVTGFIHMHEIFHNIVKRSEIPLSESEEEKLADIFAMNALGLSPPAEDIKLLNDFAAKIQNEDLRKQLSLSYDSSEFLLNLHRLGIDIYNIESTSISALPSGDKGLSRENIRASDAALQLVGSSKTSWVGFMDMAKAGLKNAAYGRKFVDEIIAKNLETAKAVLEKFGGIAWKISGDEIGFVLPGNLTKAKVLSILVALEEALGDKNMGSLASYMPIGCVKIQTGVKKDAGKALGEGLRNAEGEQIKAKEKKAEDGMVVVDLIRVNGNPQSPKVTAPAVLIAGPYVDSIKNARNNIKDDVKRSGQNYEIEDIYPSLKRENLWNVVNRAKFQNEPGIYLIRGPPDSFYVIRNYGYGMIQVIKIESEYKPISREKREEFENIIKKSGRTSITRGGYSFKCVQESFDHALGNGLIMLENLAIYNAFQPGNSALDEKDISALLEDMAKFVNSQTENLGFETVFYAYTVNTDNINGGASELMPVTEKMWEAKKTANKSGAKVLTFDYYNKNEKLINMEIGAMRIAAKAAAEKLLTEENDVLARSLKMFTDSIKKVEPTKAVIGDLARAKTDIVVIRGSGTYYSKQKSEEREISAKLHKDYGLETLPYSYKFGEGWFEDLTGEKGAERKSVLGRAVEILNDRMRNNEDDPRMIIFVPSESVDKVKEIIGQRYATVKDRISVIGELDSTPANGATDTVMHIVLGKGLLNYQRYQEKLEPEAKDRLVDLIKALVTNPEDITPAIMDELLKGIKYLRIKPVDFKDIEDWKKSQDDVLRAL